MPMATKFAELQATTRDDLVALYDRNTEHVSLGLGVIREEIHRRDAEEANSRMLSFTRHIRWLTGVVTLATIVNLAVAVFTLLRTQ